MRAHLAKIVLAALLVLILGVPFALRPAASVGGGESGRAGKLIIDSPHNEQIRYEFAHAFNRWRASRNLPRIVFDWRSGGGTSDLRKQVLAQLEASAQREGGQPHAGADLFFGGGVYAHDKLAHGVTVRRQGEEVRLSASVPVKLPPRLLKQTFPQQTLGGEPLYDPHLHWVGAALSSFGIVYNRDLLTMLHLPPPRLWRDLSDPRYTGWLALADPAHSGSIAATYQTIVRRWGWTAGWALLRRIFANTAAFTSSSSKIPVNVSAGEAAAGMCIDFYGRFQAQAIGGHRVGYVAPRFMTAITADPISILRGAPHARLAQQFVRWLLTKQAQRLWQRRRGVPGGPVRFELRRQPIRRDLYTPAEKKLWTDPGIAPFASARPFPEGMPNFFSVIAPISHAIGIDVHDELRAAWKTIQHTPADDPRKPRMLRLFDRMPPDLRLTWPTTTLRRNWRKALRDAHDPRHDQATAVLRRFHKRVSEMVADPQQQVRHRVKWTLYFRRNYRRIEQLGH